MVPASLPAPLPGTCTPEGRAGRHTPGSTPRKLCFTAGPPASDRRSPPSRPHGAQGVPEWGEGRHPAPPVRVHGRGGAHGTPGPATGAREPAEPRPGRAPGRRAPGKGRVPLPANHLPGPAPGHGAPRRSPGRSGPASPRPPDAAGRRRWEDPWGLAPQTQGKHNPSTHREARAAAARRGELTHRSRRAPASVGHGGSPWAFAGHWSEDRSGEAKTGRQGGPTRNAGRGRRRGSGARYYGQEPATGAPLRRARAGLRPRGCQRGRPRTGRGEGSQGPRPGGRGAGYARRIGSLPGPDARGPRGGGGGRHLGPLSAPAGQPPAPEGPRGRAEPLSPRRGRSGRPQVRDAVDLGGPELHPGDVHHQEGPAAG